MIGPYKTRKHILVVQISREVSSDILKKIALNFRFTPKNLLENIVLFINTPDSWVKFVFPQTFCVMTVTENFFLHYEGISK